MNSNATPTDSPLSASAPFDVGMFGLLILGLGFLFAMTYFLFIATFADGIFWLEPLTYCGFYEGPREQPHIDLAYSVNYAAWPFLIMFAFILERCIAGHFVQRTTITLPSKA